MSEIIGFNIICFAVAFFIVMLIYPGTLKEKIQFLLGEIFFTGLLTVGLMLVN